LAEIAGKAFPSLGNKKIKNRIKDKEKWVLYIFTLGPHWFNVRSILEISIAFSVPFLLPLFIGAASAQNIEEIEKYYKIFS